MDHCDACRLVYAELALVDVPGMLAVQAPRYAEALLHAEQIGLARMRPRPEVWSALEYTCHVRDVLRVQHERLGQALREDQPTFSPMGREQRVIDDGYNQQEVATVLTDLREAAAMLAGAFAALTPADWRRTGIYNWPERAERDMGWLARHTVHETIHHLDDITRGLEQLQRQGRGSARPTH